MGNSYLEPTYILAIGNKFDESDGINLISFSSNACLQVPGFDQCRTAQYICTINDESRFYETAMNYKEAFEECSSKNGLLRTPDLTEAHHYLKGQNVMWTDMIRATVLIGFNHRTD